jgi:hypothetical protein
MLAPLSRLFGSLSVLHKSLKLNRGNIRYYDVKGVDKIVNLGYNRDMAVAAEKNALIRRLRILTLFLLS